MAPGSLRKQLPFFERRNMISLALRNPFTNFTHNHGLLFTTDEVASPNKLCIPLKYFEIGVGLLSINTF